MNIKCLNNISKKGLEEINKLSNVVENDNEADCFIVRSYDMHEYNLEKNIIII